MRVFDSLGAIPEDTFSRGTAVAIGKFDGVHRGHHALLRSVAEVAREREIEPLVFTFANNPLSLLRPELCPEPLMSAEQRIGALGQEGVTTCVIVPFDEDLAAVSPEDFVTAVIVGQLNAKHLSVGDDFRFGHRGAGDPELLTKLGQKLGFEVRIIAEVEDPELGRISSSRIRAAVVQGDVTSAGRMLGRPASVRGEVVRGDARGREIGFPTANLGGELEGLAPADGVYAGWAVARGKRHRAAISVGANITFDPEGTPRVEAHLLDFEGELYGERIEVQFVRRLRGMVAFPSVEALITRMREDVRETRLILAAG